MSGLQTGLSICHSPDESSGHHGKTTSASGKPGPVAHLSRTIVQRELQWRTPADQGDWRCCGSRCAASRWTDLRTGQRELHAEIKADYHTIGLNLRPTDLSLAVSGRTIHDGRVARGMLQVSGPAQPVQAVFRAPCDVLHLHVSNAFLADCYQEAQGRVYPGDIVLGDPRFARDAAIEQLGYALLGAEVTAGSFGQLYADGLTLAIVTRLLGLYSNCGSPASPPKVAGLPRWRLNRVTDYIEAHLAESITLTDLAATTGLSRMHFAAQFRVTTGLRPHEYLLRKRIERAQDLLLRPGVSLVEVALTVGFQTQAHFTTVFKRFIGETPNQWRQLNAWTRRESARPLCGQPPHAIRGCIGHDERTPTHGSTVATELDSRLLTVRS